MCGSLGKGLEVRKLSVVCTHVIDFISCQLGHMGGVLSMLLKLVVAGVRLEVEPRTLCILDECSALIHIASSKIGDTEISRCLFV